MIFSSEKYYCVEVQSFESGMAAPLHKYITTICLISNFPHQIDWICSLIGDFLSSCFDAISCDLFFIGSSLCDLEGKPAKH